MIMIAGVKPQSVAYGRALAARGKLFFKVIISNFMVVSV